MGNELRAVVDASELAEAMRATTWGMGVNAAALPAMRSVLLEVRNGRLRMMTATLGAAGKRTYRRGETKWVPPVPAEVRGRELVARITADGELLVEARLLADLARELRGFGGPVLLEGQTQTVMGYGYTTAKYERVEVAREVPQLEVRCQRFGFVAHLAGRAADEYPSVYRDLDLGSWAFLVPTPRGAAMAA